MKAIIHYSIAFLLATPLIFSSCKKNSDETAPKEPVQIYMNAEQTRLVSYQNNFAFDIFKKVHENAGGSNNIIISPLSISLALSMTLNGANGETRSAMLEALRVQGILPDTINVSYKNLTQALLNVDKRVVISIANSVWTEQNFEVKQQFPETLTNYYDAEAESFDINDATAPDKINSWIESKTNGLIKNMMDGLTDNTVMLLINAIYFKGKWKSEFDKSKTVQSIFNKPDGASSEVPMMKQKNDFKIFSGEGFRIAELPYGQGNYVMDVILPDENTELNSVLNSLSDSNFNQWVGQMGEAEVDLSLPRFKYGYKEFLKGILSDMGMGIAFTGAADFSNISDEGLLINDVIHQAFIETNEEGTEAAAATIVEIINTSVPESVVIFNADHPFIYIIRETTTNAILFMGKIADPLQNE